MQMRSDPITKTANDRLRMRVSASRPSTSRTVTLWPRALGGVRGRKNEKMPSRAEEPYRRELLLRALHLVEGDRVDQGEGRVVAERVAEEHPEQGPRARDVRGLP